MADRILVADDQTDIVDALRLLLKGAGFTVQAADSPSAVLEAVAGREWDCVLMDLNYTARHDVGVRRAWTFSAHCGKSTAPCPS